MTTASLPAPSDAPDDAASLRLGRLRESVRGLGGSWRLAENIEQLLLIAGAILIPLGVAFIVAGWWGAAHTPRLFEQIPYAISGGILGGSLVIAGGFLYFGYWLTRLVHEGRQQTAQLAAALQQLEARLGADVEALAFDGRPASAGPAGGSGPRTFMATATGSMLHRADCPVVMGKEGLRRVSADDPGFKPCRICNPLG
jgi:hypothetical protein